MHVGECGLLQTSCECIGARTCIHVYTDEYIKHVPCQTPDTADQFTSQPVATRRPGPATLLITHSSLPSCRDERWTYMYKVDWLLLLLLHSISSYTVWVVCISLITHHGQLLILWLDIAPSEMGANT